MSFGNNQETTFITSEQKLKKLKAEISTLGSVLDGMKSEIETKKAEQEQFLGASNDVEAKKGELKSFMMQLSVLDAELNAKKRETKKFEDLTAKLAQSKADLEVIRAEEKKLTAKRYESLDVHRETQILIAKYKKERESLEGRLETLKADLNASESYLKEIDKEIAQKNKLLSERKTELETINQEIEKQAVLWNKIKDDKKDYLKNWEEEKKREVMNLGSYIQAEQERFEKIKGKKKEEADLLAGELSEKEAWLKEDRNYLREVKKDLETTYKVKIKRVI